MYTYNITFVTDPAKKETLLEYIREVLVPVLFNESSPASNPELKMVVEAGGEKPGADHGLSVALSAVLPTEKEAHLWNDHILIPALGNFHEKFGAHSLFFVTLLENLTI